MKTIYYNVYVDTSIGIIFCFGTFLAPWIFHPYTDEKMRYLLWQTILKLTQNQGHSSTLRRKMTIRKSSFKKSQGFCNYCDNGFNYGLAPFFVSPARHGEAQDLSGTWKYTKQNNNFCKNSNKHSLGWTVKTNTENLPTLCCYTFFCSAVLNFNEQLLVQYAVRFGIPNPRRLITECNFCPLKMSTLKWPAQWIWTHRCKSSCARNENCRHIEVIIPIFNPVLSIRWRNKILTSSSVKTKLKFIIFERRSFQCLPERILEW
jgi:hypothetical protein